MSTDSAPDGRLAMATVSCPVCGKRVAAGAFCGRCGAHLSPQLGDWGESLRIREYAAAPGEHVLRLSVVSSLFPRLPRRCVSAFRIGLTALLAALVVCALLRWQPPLIALCTVGLRWCSSPICDGATSTTTCLFAHWWSLHCWLSASVSGGHR